jgi:hypothetical protein
MYPGQVLLLRYEDLSIEPETTTRCPAIGYCALYKNAYHSWALGAQSDIGEVQYRTEIFFGLSNTGWKGRKYESYIAPYSGKNCRSMSNIGFVAIL